MILKAWDPIEFDVPAPAQGDPDRKNLYSPQLIPVLSKNNGKTIIFAVSAWPSYGVYEDEAELALQPTPTATPSKTPLPTTTSTPRATSTPLPLPPGWHNLFLPNVQKSEIPLKREGREMTVVYVTEDKKSISRII